MSIIKPFRADSAFPQLEIAGISELMREIFQKHLQPLGGRAYHVQDCRLSFVNCRQEGARCVLQHTLRLAEAETGCERIQLVTSVMYAEDRTPQKWGKLRVYNPEEIPDIFSTFEPFSFIPDLRMLVQVFPYDHGLPTLPLLMAGPSPELEALLLARFGPGDWHAEAWNVEPLRYRAELRATLRLTVQAQDNVTGRTEERHFYAKVYNDKEKGEQTYQVLRALWDKTSAGDAGFTVGRPIAYLNGLRTLLQEETPGTSLEDILLQQDEATPAMRKAAGTLVALHLDHVPMSRRRCLRNEIATLERVGKLLQWACPHLRAEVQEIVGAVVAGLEEVALAPTHGDLKLEHILFDGDRLALLDLDGFAEADPVLDAAKVLAHLAGMPFRFPLPDGCAQTAARAFAGEYFAHVPETWRDRLPLHYAGAILKIAAGFFINQEPGWPDTITTLVEEAKGSLAGKVW
jgi:Phosphotransferase enzyme family